jgi:hypothetical protein
LSRSASRRWAAFCLVGIALWVGITVLVAALNDDPGDGRAVVLAFAGGGAVFFGAVFGIAWWQLRTPPDPELDALLAELALEPGAIAGNARAMSGMRRIARMYVGLGALVTALGMAAIVQEGFGVGSVSTTLTVLVAVVVAWAAAVPLVLRRAREATASVLGPLGLTQHGPTLTGERHGRAVSVALGPHGSITRVASDTEPPPLTGAAEILARAGRGDTRTWEGVEVAYDDSAIAVRRDARGGAVWIWDLWLAEELAR